MAGDMAKNDRKKKKTTPRKNPAHAQQERRRRINEWMDLVGRMCEACGAGDLFGSLTESERSYFEAARVPPIQLRKAAGHEIPAEVFSRLDSLFRNTIQKDVVHVPPSKKLIGLGEFLRAEAALRGIYIYSLTSTKDRAARWVERLEPFKSFVDDKDAHVMSPMMKLWTLMSYYGALCGDMKRMVFPVRLQWETQTKELSRMFQYFEISSMPAEHRVFQLGQQKRRSYRLLVQSVVALKVYPAELSTKVIPGLEDQPERRLPVYVQEHVRLRMNERLDPLAEDEMDHLLGDTMTSPKTVPLRGGAFLIELQMYHCLLGYVVAEVVNDGGGNAGEAVLMRTFLFVTQSGTPEGDRFNERLKVGNYEKSYFRLDRLAPFMTTDLCLDPVFQGILRECGIGDLIEVVKINRQIRSSLETREGNAEDIRNLLNIDAPSPGDTPPGSRSGSGRDSTSAPAPSPRRFRILRRGHRRPLNAFVRRPWIPKPLPAPTPPPPPVPSFPGPRRRAFVPLNARRRLRYKCPQHRSLDDRHHGQERP